jgi:hypothetical protein
MVFLGWGRAGVRIQGWRKASRRTYYFATTPRPKLSTPHTLLHAAHNLRHAAPSQPRRTLLDILATTHPN